ncbi:hypothetical protein VTJ04DRAFT_2318 [Mycothermus thermophilus]|uniref:uncharacterized protein n=1 Tax=Humicola insolens TaxID=85995 RepID=UPI0037424F11
MWVPSGVRPAFTRLAVQFPPAPGCVCVDGSGTPDIHLAGPDFGNTKTPPATKVLAFSLCAARPFVPPPSSVASRAVRPGVHLRLRLAPVELFRSIRRRKYRL